MSEKERTRAEQERYDLETLARYQELVIRFGVFGNQALGNPFAFAQLHRQIRERLPDLLEKEGY